MLQNWIVRGAIGGIMGYLFGLLCTIFGKPFLTPPTLEGSWFVFGMGVFVLFCLFYKAKLTTLELAPPMVAGYVIFMLINVI